MIETILTIVLFVFILTFNLFALLEPFSEGGYYDSFGKCKRYKE